MRGGNFDVDALVTSPRNNTIYVATRKPSGLIEWNSDADGVYRFCFSNRFSAITHKNVYFDFHIIDNSALESSQAGDAAVNYVRTFLMS